MNKNIIKASIISALTILIFSTSNADTRAADLLKIDALITQYRIAWNSMPSLSVRDQFMGYTYSPGESGYSYYKEAQDLQSAAYANIVNTENLLFSLAMRYLVKNLITQDEYEKIIKANVNWRDPNRVAPAQIELKTKEELQATIKRFTGRVVFVGHGSKSQYGDIFKVTSSVDRMVEKYNKKYGVGQWIAMFGGDSYNEGKPDIAFAMKYLKLKYSIPLFAAQSDVVKEWGGVDKHIDFISWVPTTTVPQVDSAGKPIVDDNGKIKTQIVWGGFRNGQAVGPTSVLLATGNDQIATDIVALGGGPVAAEEFHFAQMSMNLPYEYIPLETKFPEVNGIFGTLGTAAMSSSNITTFNSKNTSCGELIGLEEKPKK